MQFPGMRLLLSAMAAGTVCGKLLISMDFPGNDLEMTVAPDAKYCQIICTQHPFCTHFTFVTEDLHSGVKRSSCFLKYNALRNPGVPVPMDNVVSGYSLAKDDINLNLCFPKLLPNINFPGNTFQILPADNMTDCQNKCSGFMECQLFSFVGPNLTDTSISGSQCCLKFNTNLPSPPTIVATPGMKSGFSLRDCCTGDACTQGCADLIIPDLDFQGSDITQIKSASVSECQSACTKHPQCHFFTFHTQAYIIDSSTLLCYLRSSASGIPTGMSPLPNVLSGFTKKSTEFQKSEQDCAVFLLPNFGFPGGDIESIFASDVGHCQRICTQHPRCQFFTFFTEAWSTDDRKFACTLKMSDTKIPQSVIPLRDVISGFSLTSAGLQKSGKECAELIIPNMDFTWDDLGSAPFASDPAECQQLCTADSKCQFFTYISSNCLFKGNSVGVPTNPTVRANVFSGFSLRSSGVQKADKGCSDLIMPGVNFPGHDIDRVLAVDARHCQLLCTYHPQCLFFTFFPKESNPNNLKFYCYLKGKDVALPPSVKQFSYMVSGFAAAYHAIQQLLCRICWFFVGRAGFYSCITQAYPDVDFPGEGERTLQTASFELCQKVCTEDPSCQFFSYATPTFDTVSARGTCYPKNVIVRPSPNPIEFAKNVTSGFPLRKCFGEIAGYRPPLAPETSTC